MRRGVAVAGVILLEMALSGAVHDKPSLAESVLHLFLVDTANTARDEPKDQAVVDKEYDFVIVGAGSAGCVVANRLSEVRKWRILLIEAGGEENFLMDVPLIVNYFQFSKANWMYKTEPSSEYCLGMEGGRCHWPRGKVMGGSSVLNYMIYTRGNRRDYDKWEELGNEGWNWESVLPYFEKVESARVPEFESSKEYHSARGHVSVTDIPYRTPIADAFVSSGRYMGYPTLDYDSENQIGFNYLRVSMDNGTRCSSSRAYLHPIRTRPNLFVKKRSFVTRVVIDPDTRTAVGVEFVHNRSKYVVRARKEVILSGGSINSPHILMLSGVGPKSHLAAKKIRVVKDSRVGYNLQDHYLPGGITHVIDKPYSLTTSRIIGNRDDLVDFLSFHSGPITIPGGCEALAYFNTNDNSSEPGYPDMELLLISGSLPSDDSLCTNFNVRESICREVYEPLKGNDTIMVFPILIRPESKGRILLRDADPFHHPLIYPNYFSDPGGRDMKVILSGIRESNRILSMPPFRKLGARLHKTPLPPCRKHKFDSDAYWECFARHMTFTIYHPVGTCKMGPESDPGAVVDARLRVRGVKNLRVVDASIMPVIPTAHTNAPTYMIAEKASDMIKQDWRMMQRNAVKRSPRKPSPALRRPPRPPTAFNLYF